MTGSSPVPLWHPSKDSFQTTKMGMFGRHVMDKYGETFRSYHDLHRWSVRHSEDFWEALWDFVGIESSADYDCVIDDPSKFPGAEWFPGARVNAAEVMMRFCFVPGFQGLETHLLVPRDKIALKCRGECTAHNTDITYSELLGQVHAMQCHLAALGVQPGDRVVGILPHTSHAVVAMLGALSLGAVWAACSPEFGAQGALDRIGQVQPSVLVACGQYTYKGKVFDIHEKVSEIVGGIDTLKHIILADGDLTKLSTQNITMSDYASVLTTPLPVDSSEMEFCQVAVSHPIYIVFSSGTTGLPKCLVQGFGVILNHLKEHVLHTDIGSRDTLFYYTTCAWMMWNWLVSGLASGCTLLLYDGNPVFPATNTLLETAIAEGVTVFGTSAKYIQLCKESGVGASGEYRTNPPPFRAILSTGSPLYPSDYEYIHSVFGDIQIGSISGGSDLNGCWVASCPLLPVHSGEIQCVTLGHDVGVYDSSGKAVMGQDGELVVRAPSPSMPLRFWGDDPEMTAYRRAYFGRYEGVWCHGDFARISPQTRGVVILGRSDATLNVHGVRIGTAEIYRALEGVAAVADAVAVEKRVSEETSHLVLFVQTATGIALTAELCNVIRNTIRTHLTPRHVPAEILHVPEIPYTTNGKKVEVAVRQAIHGERVSSLTSLVNPACLSAFTDRARKVCELQ